MFASPPSPSPSKPLLICYAWSYTVARYVKIYVYFKLFNKSKWDTVTCCKTLGWRFDRTFTVPGRPSWVRNKLGWGEQTPGSREGGTAFAGLRPAPLTVPGQREHRWTVRGGSLYQWEATAVQNYAEHVRRSLQDVQNSRASCWWPLMAKHTIFGGACVHLVGDAVYQEP